MESLTCSLRYRRSCLDNLAMRPAHVILSLLLVAPLGADELLGSNFQL